MSLVCSETIVLRKPKIPKLKGMYSNRRMAFKKTSWDTTKILLCMSGVLIVLVESFKYLADIYYTFTQRLMYFKSTTKISEPRKERYDNLLKNPRNKELVSLYALLVEVPDNILPTLLGCGANFLKTVGLSVEKLPSERLLELTFNFFFTQIKAKLEKVKVLVQI